TGAHARHQRALSGDGAALRARVLPAALVAVTVAVSPAASRSEHYAPEHYAEPIAPPALLAFACWDRMSSPQETLLPPSTVSSPEIALTGPSDRRGDVDVKQTLVAGLLQEQRCDGLLVLDPDNFSWLTSGGAARGVLDGQSLPGLYYTPDSRWALS